MPSFPSHCMSCLCLKKEVKKINPNVVQSDDRYSIRCGHAGTEWARPNLCFLDSKSWVRVVPKRLSPQQIELLVERTQARLLCVFTILYTSPVHRDYQLRAP